MISRASTKAIAEAYNACFSSYSRGSHNSTVFELHVDALYDFLYVNNFEAWFLNLANGKYPHLKRQLLEFVLRIHTGESLVTATDGWSWKQRQSFGQRLLADLARALIAERRTNPQFAKYQPRHADVVDTMQRQLELDGYVYREGILLVPEESVLDEEEEEGVLQQLFTELGLQQREVFDHHLRLSSEHYRAGKWDDCIANSRKVLEAVLQQAAVRFGTGRVGGGLSAADLERPVKVRDYLERVGLLGQKEKEAVAKIYALLSDTGAHPYIAKGDQARLLRHYALTTYAVHVVAASGGTGGWRRSRRSSKS